MRDFVHLKRADNEILKAKGWGPSPTLNTETQRPFAFARLLPGRARTPFLTRPASSPSWVPVPAPVGRPPARPTPPEHWTCAPVPTGTTEMLNRHDPRLRGGERLPACCVTTQERSVCGVRSVYGGSHDWRLRRRVFPQDAPACSLHPRPSRIPGGSCRLLGPGADAEHTGLRGAAVKRRFFLLFQPQKPHHVRAGRHLKSTPLGGCQAVPGGLQWFECCVVCFPTRIQPL